jgi:hypothetical protein
MKVVYRQISKRNTNTEIYMTPQETLRLIGQLAIGVDVATRQHWNNYCAGYYKIDEFNSITFKVAEE